jgi:predicted metal-dependent enzyme (double-stranded beta helix superfamily)
MTAAFNFDKLVADLRAAAAGPDGPKAVRALLESEMADPARVAAGVPDYAENDIILHEDETVSIWHCRFMPGTTVPAHDHKVSAVIGVYAGRERNDFFESDGSGGLQRSSAIEVSPGDVLSIGPSAIHSVSCISPAPCCGIHVYLGNLTGTERSLFDPETGTAMAFTMENYEKLQRPDQG